MRGHLFNSGSRRRCMHHVTLPVGAVEIYPSDSCTKRMLQVMLPDDVVEIDSSHACTVGELKTHLAKHYGKEKHTARVFIPQRSAWDRFNKDPVHPSDIVVVTFDARRFPRWACPFRDDQMKHNVFFSYTMDIDVPFLRDLAVYSIRRGFTSIHSFLSHLQLGTSGMLYRHKGTVDVNQQTGWLFRSISGSHPKTGDGWLLMRWWLSDTSSICWHCPYRDEILLFVPFDTNSNTNTELHGLFARSAFSKLLVTISRNILNKEGVSLRTPFSTFLYSKQMSKAISLQTDPVYERALWAYQTRAWHDAHPSTSSSLVNWTKRMHIRPPPQKRTRISKTTEGNPC